MAKNKREGSCGKSLYHLDPKETETDCLTARWIVFRPDGDTRRHFQGYRVNDELNGILVRDADEARVLSLSAGWLPPVPFPVKEEGKEVSARAPYTPSREDVSKLPDAPVPGKMRTRDNMHLWPYDMLTMKAQSIQTAGAELPPRPNRKQLATFIRAKTMSNAETARFSGLAELQDHMAAQGIG